MIFHNKYYSAFTNFELQMALIKSIITFKNRVCQQKDSSYSLPFHFCYYIKIIQNAYKVSTVYIKAWEVAN
jgi:hypothetical protein